MRDHAKKIIALDPYYGNGGGYLCLEQSISNLPIFHFSYLGKGNEKAIEYLGKAYNTGQRRPSQAVVARALYKDGRKEEAKELLNLLLKQPYSESEPVEDFFEQHEIARELLTTWE